MDNRQKLAILKQYILFKDLPEKELSLLAQKAKEKIFSNHTIILSQTEPAKEVLLIHEGLIKIYILNEEGKTIPIRIKGPLYIVGEINIVDGDRSATIETLQPTHALSFPIHEMKRLLLTYPHFSFNLLGIIVEKLRAANKQTEYYFSASLKERTWTIIRTMAVYFSNKEITLSHEELSDTIGATRAKVTEALQELQQEKLIAISYRNIRVL